METDYETNEEEPVVPSENLGFTERLNVEEMVDELVKAKKLLLGDTILNDGSCVYYKDVKGNPRGDCIAFESGLVGLFCNGCVSKGVEKFPVSAASEEPSDNYRDGDEDYLARLEDAKEESRERAWMDEEQPECCDNCGKVLRIEYAGDCPCSPLDDDDNEDGDGCEFYGRASVPCRGSVYATKICDSQDIFWMCEVHQSINYIDEDDCQYTDEELRQLVASDSCWETDCLVPSCDTCNDSHRVGSDACDVCGCAAIHVCLCCTECETRFQGEGFSTTCSPPHVWTEKSILPTKRSGPTFSCTNEPEQPYPGSSVDYVLTLDVQHFVRKAIRFDVSQDKCQAFHRAFASSRDTTQREYLRAGGYHGLDSEGEDITNE